MLKWCLQLCIGFVSAWAQTILSWDLPRALASLPFSVSLALRRLLGEVVLVFSTLRAFEKGGRPSSLSMTT